MRPAVRFFPGRTRPRLAEYGAADEGREVRVVGPAGETVRLQKVLAEAGVASRRAAEELIRAGRVAVDGQVVAELGFKVDPTRAHLTVDGRPVVPAGRKVYLLLNKPVGVITTARDPQGRPTVLDLVEGIGERVFPVGRLDFDTEGLLLLTNDGELANRLMHPRHHVPKRYLAEVEGRVAGETLRQLASGIELEDGRTAPAEVRLLESGARGSLVELTLWEGRKRQVRRMLGRVGHPVKRLRRFAYGPLTLEGLAPGEWRELRPDEVAQLRQAADAQS